MDRLHCIKLNHSQHNHLQTVENPSGDGYSKQKSPGVRPHAAIGNLTPPIEASGPEQREAERSCD